MKVLAASTLVLSLLSTCAIAQPVYRCGNAYSQTGCTQGGGKLVEATDPRSGAQRAEARRLAADERRLAADLQRDRLADEKALKPGGAANVGSAPLPPVPAAATARRLHKKSRVAGPKVGDDFVAVDPSSRKRRRGT